MAFPRGAAGTVAAVLTVALSVAACAVGPNYITPAAPVPTTYKHLKGWKLAAPSDGVNRGDWWSFYRDPKLAFLLQQVAISNQTVAAEAAAYEQARALIRQAQASLFPILTGSYNASRERIGPNASVSGFAPGVTLYRTTYTPGLSGSWDLDVWGKVRRQIESNTAGAQATAADLANAELSAQAQLATAYFNLRSADSLHDLLARTVADYKKTLMIVQYQYKAGYAVTKGDLATARAQVETAQAQLLNVGVARAQYEDAIAVLVGRPPAELSIAHRDLTGTIPKIPINVPSTLLERRPDIASAERTMEKENALIGVAEAAFYPDISLSGALQWVGKHPLPFDVTELVWSLGAAASEPILEGGLRAADEAAARAAYWQAVANYRQTVLTAFEQVENELAAIHFLAEQLKVQEQAVKDDQTAVNVYLTQFRAGTTAFTTVVTAQITLLGAEEAALTVRQNLFLDSVALIEALGGGWNTALLPTQKELAGSFSILPQVPRK